MKKIVLYTRRNVGIYSLSFLVSLGYEVKVITDDENVRWLAEVLHCEQVTFDTMGDFDLFLSVHGWKYVDEKYIKGKLTANLHPMLFKYVGHNPVKRVIENGDTIGSVESHVMDKNIDGGEIIHQEFFPIPKCNNYADYYNIAAPFYYKCLFLTLKKIKV